MQPCSQADISFHRLIKKGYIAKIPFFIFFITLRNQWLHGCMAANRPLSDNNPRLFSNNLALLIIKAGLL